MEWWIAAGTLISGVGGLVLSTITLFRNWKHEAERMIAAKQSKDAKESASASSVGLRYLQEALEFYSKEVIRMQGELGAMSEKLHNQEVQHRRELVEIEARYQSEIAELKRRLGDVNE